LNYYPNLTRKFPKLTDVFMKSLY